MTVCLTRSCLAAAALTSLCGVASAAEPGPLERPHASTSVSIGAGVLHDSRAYWATGAALRGGYTFATPLYVGAMGGHYWGRKDDWSSGTTTRRTVALTIEVGYELHGASWFVLPSIGVGAAWFRDATQSQGYAPSRDTHRSVLLSPGVSGGVIAGRWLLGVDGRAMVAPETRARDDVVQDLSGLTVHGVVGAVF